MNEFIKTKTTGLFRGGIFIKIMEDASIRLSTRKEITIESAWNVDFKPDEIGAIVRALLRARAKAMAMLEEA